MVYKLEHTMRQPKLFNVRGKYQQQSQYIAIQYNDFDSLILGSSMSTNFLCTEFDSIFGANSLKLAQAGGSLPTAMKLAAYTMGRKPLKYVLVDLSAPHFQPENYKFDDDVSKGKYLERLDELISLDSICYACNFFLNHQNTPISRDDYGAWTLGGKYASPLIRFASKAQTQRRPNENTYNITPQNTARARNVFAKVVFPLIKRYPDTTFLFFFPPHTFLTFQDLEFVDIIEYKRMVMKGLNAYPNVRLFDFQNAREITDNLENFRDYSHYMNPISSWILHQIAADNYWVCPENREEILESFLHSLQTYDYQADRKFLEDVNRQWQKSID
ncbi:MAG: hypothetical protein WCT05_14395 [Lentisphaeria bacterium]